MTDALKMWRQRRAARLVAVQALYEREVAGTAAEIVLANFLNDRWAAVVETHHLGHPDVEFLRRLVLGVAATCGELDGAIQRALDKDRPIDRLEVLMRTILRAGAYELLAVPDVPKKVIINEYVEVAHAFFGGNEPGIVNAVLDRIASHLRDGRDLPGGCVASDNSPLDGKPIVTTD